MKHHEVRKICKKMGWKFGYTKNGHLKMTKNQIGTVYISASSSDPNILKVLEAKLKRKERQSEART